MAQLALASCATGATLESTGPGEGTGGSGGGRGGLASGQGGAGGGSPAWDPGVPWSAEPCSEATKRIYVVSTAGGLYSYAPDTDTLHELGHLACDVPGFDPLSMAVDRQGRAWVHYWDGSIQLVDLQTGACEPSGFASSVFPYFGMAFAADAETPGGDRLFVRQAAFYDAGTDPGVRALGRIDTESLALEVLGTGEGANADLTGTGDGRLFAFVRRPDGAASVIELDPANGASLSDTLLPGVTIGTAWAFASWGGDLWLFSNGLEGQSTAIRRFDPEAGVVTVVRPELGFSVVGAGVSSCAPIEPPR